MEITTQSFYGPQSASAQRYTTSFEGYHSCPKCDLMRGEPDKALLRLHLFLDHHKKRWEAKLDSVAAMPIGDKWEVKCQR